MIASGRAAHGPASTTTIVIAASVGIELAASAGIELAGPTAVTASIETITGAYISGTTDIVMLDWVVVW